MRILPWVAVLALAGAALADEDGFVDLFNGRDMSGWNFRLEGDADPAKTFRVEDGAILCSGQPAGYMITDRPYGDYILRYEWRYLRPEGLKDDAEFGGNSGCLIHIRREGALGIWPESIEVQGMNRDAGHILPIPRGVRCRFEHYEEARRGAIKPLGEWNANEIVCRGGTVAVTINGVLVSRVLDGELVEGPIAWQSEGAEIHWRRIRLKQLPRSVPSPTIRSEAGYAVIETHGARVRYTLDGTEPTPSSGLYVSPLEAPKGAVVTAGVFPADNPGFDFPSGPVIVRQRLARPKSGWEVVHVDSQETKGENGRAGNAIDDDPLTKWHTEWEKKAPPHPHEIAIDMGEELELSAFGYLPRTDGGPNGTILEYELYVSLDGEEWGSPAASGTFGTAESMQEQVVKLPEGTRARFIRLVAKSEIHGNPWTSAAEINVYE